MVQVGDIVERAINSSDKRAYDGGFVSDLELNVHKGVVVYVHPRGRFYTVEFDFAEGKLRENYYT